jgi:hypothetical protein
MTKNTKKKNGPVKIANLNSLNHLTNKDKNNIESLASLLQFMSDKFDKF